MKALRLIFGLAAVLLSGCATTVVPTRDARPVPTLRVLSSQWLAPAPDTGALIVKRDDGLTMGGCLFRLLVDGTVVADFKRSEKLDLFLPIGEHLLAASARCPISIGGILVESSVVIVADETKTFRISATQPGDLRLQPSAF